MQPSSCVHKRTGAPSHGSRTPLAKLPPLLGVLLIGARRAPPRPLVAEQALAASHVPGRVPTRPPHVLHARVHAIRNTQYATALTRVLQNA